MLGPAPGESIARLWRAQTSIDDEGALVAKQSTAPAESLVVDGSPVLTLTCNFEQTTIPRGVWDRTVELDLTGCTAVCFDVFAENLPAISRANLYLRSGDGWYGAYWYPSEEGRWCRIRLPLGEFYVDKPGGGWADIRTIRFSPWAGLRQDAVLHIANFGLERMSVPAAVVLPEYLDRDGRPVDAGSFPETVSGLLDGAGCPLPTLSSGELSAQRLADLKLLFLPYASGMPAEQADAIAEFVRAGGRLIAFFAVPEQLAELLGVRQRGYRSAARAGEFSAMR
ncbi:MAG: hypothetical protein ACP5KN_21065, partial [Armatimonadota bacterium]